MKKILIGLLLGLSTIAMASNEKKVGEWVSADLNVEASVIAPLTIKEKQSIKFGDIILGSGKTAPQKGIMEIKGAPCNTICVAYPDSLILQKERDTSKKIFVKLIHTDRRTIKTLGGDGRSFETIGATIDSAQVKHVGNYHGVVNVSVRYN